MSGDFGFFEVLASSPDAEQEAQREASDRLAAATYDVREQFGDFLFQARSVREYRDRCALVKDDAIRLVGNHLMPITGVMRRIGLTGRGGQLEKEFRNRLAAEYKTHSPTNVQVNAEDPSGRNWEGYFGSPERAEEWGKSREVGDPYNAIPDTGHAARRRQADMTGPEMHNDETFQDHQGEELIPEGDFHGYLDDVDQGAPSKEDHNFVGEGHDHTGDPADTDFVREGLHSPKEWFDYHMNGGNGDPDYDYERTPRETERFLKNDPNYEPTDREIDLVNRRRKYKGQPAYESKPEQAPAPATGKDVGDPWNGKGAAVFRQYVAFCRRNRVPLTITALERHGKRLSSADYLTIAAGLQHQGAPAGGAPTIDPPIGPFEDPGSTFTGDHLDNNYGPASEFGGRDMPNQALTGQRRYAHGYLSWCRKHHLVVASVDNLRNYGKHTARVNPEGYRYVAGQLRRTITSARARYAAPDYLNKANEALTNLLNQRAEEFQETIAPLQQALQVVQQAEALQQAANPLGVQPPAGTVNVMPESPAAAGGMPPPGGDPSGGGDAAGGDPAAAAMALAGGGAPPGGDPTQQMAASRRKRGGSGKARGAARPLTGAGILDKWDEYSKNNTLMGSEDDITNFAQQHGVGERGKSQLRQHLWGQGGQLATGMRKGAPFADYEDFDDCTSKNSDKNDPDAYCGEIKHRTEDKTSRRRRASRPEGPPPRRVKGIDHDNPSLDEEFANAGVDDKGLRDTFDDTRFPGTNSRLVGRRKQGGYFWHGKELTPENADRFLKAKDNTVVVTMTHPDGSSKDLTWRDVHDEGGNYLGLPKHSKRTQFKVAWMGWGPAPENRGTPRVAGWDWDNHLLAYTSNTPREFTCSCGETHEVPGYHTCRCGKIWNGYVIGSGGETHEASAEKFLVREIPVRPDVIVANRRVAFGETPHHPHGGQPPVDLSWHPTETLIKEHLTGDHPWHGDIGRELGYRATHDDDADAMRYLQRAAKKGLRMPFGGELGHFIEQGGQQDDDDDELGLPFPSDHHPKTPELGATPDDWHSRSPKGQWTRGQAPRRKQPART